ncbi:hypothetical protein [Falsochrobactrum shanghaiense]|uniref:hypothetical protein n=1 Tax=Falsochrobactrum shanghaiense TaxID=2201899 RepID=UPI0011B22C66|nr:hypothetical protein [Falsochrobactrum shanghaiense]
MSTLDNLTIGDPDHADAGKVEGELTAAALDVLAERRRVSDLLCNGKLVHASLKGSLHDDLEGNSG